MEYPLVMTNIAMENGAFIDGFPFFVFFFGAINGIPSGYD